ncbi:hypothetical protein OEZ86_003070 [Tetradesmus obliquus]|nr:hypothetical protein OEZ86_003070 [Tetradesmus obliquus]
MGIPISDSQAVLQNTKLDMSHQEASRLVEHLQTMWEGYCTDGEGNSNGCEWLPVEQIGSMMCQELGYEDEPEFEDALKGSFADFLDKLPYVVKQEKNGKLYFQIKPELPRSQWRATKMTVKISSTADLWRTCYKSPYATIEIPELEFEFSADGKRHTDSIYNHIGSAVYNLGNYVQQGNSGLSDDHKNKIMDTVIALNMFLDVPVPWTWVVHDPSGMSEFKPMDGHVEVEYLEPEPAAEPAAAAAAAEPAAAGEAAAGEAAAGEAAAEQPQEQQQ